MPPVVAAVAVFAAQAAVVAGVITATTAAMIGLAAAAGSLLYMQSKMPGSQDVPDVSNQQQMAVDGKFPHQRIYGRAKVSGQIALTEERGGERADDGTWRDELLDVVIAYAAHPVHAVKDCWLGDEKYQVPNGSWEISPERQRWRLLDGKQVAGSGYLQDLVDETDNWFADMTMTGHSAIWWQGEYHRETFPRGFENLAVTVEGLELFDPRSNSTYYSLNSALAALDFLKNVFLVPDSQIDLNSFKAAANVCDEQVLYTDKAGSTKNEPRYSCSGMYRYDAPYKAGMQAILDTCYGRLIYDDGMYKLLVGAYPGPAIKELREDSLAGDVSLVPWLSDKDHFNTITGTYVDPDEFVECDFPALTDPNLLAKDGREITSDVSYKWVSSPSQAQRLAKIHMMRSIYSSILTWPCNLMGLDYEVGDVVAVYLEELGLDGQEYLVVKREFTAQGGITLTLEREDINFYSDAVYNWPPIGSITNLPDGTKVYQPVDLQFTETLENNYYQGKFTWDHPTKNAVSRYLVQVVRNGTIMYTEERPDREFFITSLDVGNYEFRVSAFNYFGKKSPDASLAFNINIPPKPIDVHLTITNFVVVLKPVIAGDIGYNTVFEYYWSQSNDINSKQYLGRGRTLEHSGLSPLTTYYYWVRSINLHGTSEYIAVTATTTANPNDILQVIEGHIGKDQLDKDTQDLLDQIGSTTIQDDIDRIRKEVYEQAIAQGLGEVAATEAASRIAVIQENQEIINNEQQLLAKRQEVILASTDTAGAVITDEAAAKIGYCTIGDHDTKEECEAAGGTWVRAKPFASRVLAVGVLAGGKELTIQQGFKAFENDIGDLMGQAYLAVNDDGRVSGLFITAGSQRSSFDVIADAFGIVNPDTRNYDIYWDTNLKTLVVRGRMILGDGYVVDGEDAIRAKDGRATVMVYRKSTSIPSAPTDLNIPPPGWSLAPPTVVNLQEKLYMTAALRDGDKNIVASGWGPVTQISGNNGVDGSDGQSLYTWVKYADTSTGSGISDSPVGKKYIGIAINKTTPVESSTPGDYTWQKVEGDQGIPGEPGADGKSLYTWVKYADTNTGGGMSDSPVGKKYLGLAYNKTSATEGTNPADYVWSLIEGPKGADGQSLYTWVKYADTSTGGGMSDSPVGKKYIGIAVNKASPVESSTPGDYTWQKVEGDQGIPGTPGDDGKSLYTWVKYADTSTGGGMSDSPVGKKYLGLAYNKTSAAEGTNPADYLWSLIEGQKGDPGTPGADGDPGMPGAGFYSIPNSTGVFPTSTATVNALFLQAFGRNPVIDDNLTFYKSTDPKVASTKRYTGSSWVTPNFILHGDMLVRGTVTGDRFVAGTEISAPYIKGGRIEIGGIGGVFNVGANGKVDIKSTTATNTARMALTNDRLDVYDDNNRLVVRIGRIS